MGDVIAIRRVKPPVSVVCGLYVGWVEEGWYVFRWSTPAEKAATGLQFQTLDGPIDDKLTAERCARRIALRPVRSQEVPNGT